MRRLVSVAVSVAATMAALLTVPAPAEAATPRIEITRVNYDPPGTDVRTNEQLNDEWVRLTSRRSFSINLKGWTLRDRGGIHIYRFSSNFWLGPGRSVLIHTGDGTNNSAHRFWGMGNFVWNNDGDWATLRNPSGKIVDRCMWDGGRPGYTYCR
jgi:hypothetical protein